MSKITIYVSKYALNSGILQIDADSEYTVEDGNGTISSMNQDNPFFFRKGFWSYDKQKAIAQAKAIQQEEIDSLEQQIKKLKAIKFD